jgi:hypothetical protein
MVSFFRWVPFLGLLLGACSAPIERTPPPTPHVIRLAYTQSAERALPAIEACAQSQTGLALLPSEGAPAYLLDTPADLFIKVGPPVDLPAFAAPLANEQILIAVHRDNPVDRLSTAAIRAIFQGTTRNWADLGGPDLPIRVWTYPPGDEIEEAFARTLFSDGINNTHAYLAPGPRAMLSGLSEDPSSIGYLPASWLDQSLKRVGLENELAGALIQPVLVLAEGQPAGPVLVLVDCLQSGLGARELRKVYP